jgi:hypothetical protein
MDLTEKVPIVFKSHLNMSLPVVTPSSMQIYSYVQLINYILKEVVYIAWSFY